jgi:hypothetical protein
MEGMGGMGMGRFITKVMQLTSYHYVLQLHTYSRPHSLLTIFKCLMRTTIFTLNTIRHQGKFLHYQTLEELDIMGPRSYVIVYHDLQTGRYIRAERLATSMRVLVDHDPIFEDDYKTVTSVEMCIEEEDEDEETDAKPA